MKRPFLKRCLSGKHGDPLHNLANAGAKLNEANSLTDELPVAVLNGHHDAGA
jgi:hypothetical protein